MKTVHLVFNSHIDPIWLWPWQSGLDEVLATCRSACDRLDAHPDLTFTRGEAWVYDEIERIDPALFERMRAHIAAGRWEIIGGWWLQPDCNQPSGFAMERQIELGKRYFESRFGSFPRIAYNVDSFGHAKSLPDIMHAAGQDRYVMMRPQQAELNLPNNLFRWRSTEDGPEVITWRIVKEYNLGTDMQESKVRAAFSELPEGIDDCMLFVGFGDHGGGPTERQIQWLRDHKDAFNDFKMVFSSPSKFFEAIWSKRDKLPLIVGELQHHAVGCYSVYRPIKTAVRKAEHAVRQAELFCAAEPSFVPSDASVQIEEAWKRIAFNHFHDTLGGTCMPSAYIAPLAQLGYAQNVADNLLHEGLRRKITALPDDPLQRIVLYNASDLAYEGPVEFTPWLDWQQWKPGYCLLDEAGNQVPVQLIAPETQYGEMANLLFPMKMAPQSIRVLRIAHEGATEVKSVITNTNSAITSAGTSLTDTQLEVGSIKLPLPELIMYTDESDTWGHGIDRFSDTPLEGAKWGPKELVDNGPRVASWIRRGSIGDSTLHAEWRVYGAGGFVELKLAVNWREQHKVLKLVQPLHTSPATRTDGILGGWVGRVFDGRELPMRDGILIESDNGNFAIAAPDVYGVDATPERIRFTLLRSPAMAHHEPVVNPASRRIYSDQGEHKFIFRYFGGEAATTNTVDQHAWHNQRPLVIADLTRGMPMRLYDMEIKALDHTTE